MKIIFRKLLSNLVLITGVISILSISCCSQKPIPIPENKVGFIGVWQAHSGFKIDIKASGTADVYEHNLPLNSDNMKLIIGITTEYAKDLLVDFRGDSVLGIIKPTVRARQYRIDRNPYLDGDTMKMVLNGVVLFKQK